jgi:hypothetical protein
MGNATVPELKLYTNATIMKNSRKIGVESLERRQLMAGDIFAALEGSFLRVEGDNLDNQIAMTRTATGDIVIAGQNGTLVNGLPSVRFPAVQLNALELRMADGNDTVALRGLQVANDLFADLGAGNDRLTAPATAATTVNGNMTVLGSEGNDIVQLAGLTVREDMFLDGGLGSINASIQNSSIDKVMSIIGDEADDVVSLAGTRVGLDLLVETKGGSDRVTLTDLNALHVSINTDSNGAVGLDQVTLNRVTAVEDIGIFTGAGNDIVRLTDVTSGKSIIASLDEGNDRLIATRVSAAEDAVFEGGAGVDTLENFGIFAGIKREFKEFEVLR